MKILMSSAYESRNSYIKDIVDNLRPFATVQTEVSTFWDSTEDFDILHIQWPEELFSWNIISNEDLQRLKNRIQQFKNKGSKLVITLHNAIPHRSKTNADEDLYRFIYNEADAIVNLGEYSSTMYPEKKNTVIFHPNYEKHIKIEAKQKSDIFTFLSFGNIRKPQEEQQIIDAFIEAKIPNAQLIITSSLIAHNPYFKEGKWSLRKWKYIFYLKKLAKKNIVLVNKKLSPDEVNLYFNKANAVISPRIENLNSGVVFMGFSFGKIVLGPNIGNISEFLVRTENLIFEPQNRKSIAKAMQKATTLQHIGESNLKFSREILSPEKIAKEHLNLYTELIQNRES